MYTSFHLQKIVKNNIACTYDIRDDVFFPIVNFLFFNDDVLLAPSYGVCISIAFHLLVIIVITKTTVGYRFDKLLKMFTKLYYCYKDNV